jgi:hypothetical protein
MVNGGGLIFAGLNLGCLVLITLPFIAFFTGFAFFIHPTLGWVVFMGLCFLIGQIIQMEKSKYPPSQ